MLLLIRALVAATPMLLRRHFVTLITLLIFSPADYAAIILFSRHDAIDTSD